MEKRIPVIILIVIATILHVSAQEMTTFHLGDIHRLVDITTPNSFQTTERHDLSGCPEVLPRNARVSKPTRSEVTFKDITVTEAGTLAALLGSETNDIDSLVVRGPINDEDIHTIWAASFYDGVTIVNLENATIQGNRLPEDAFWHQSEQYTFGDDYINCIPLRRIILPEGLTEIGEMAFSYAISLKVAEGSPRSQAFSLRSEEVGGRKQSARSPGASSELN